MRFLITGARRGIGRRVAEELITAGHEVYAVLRPGSDDAGLQAAGRVDIDLARPDTVAEAAASLAGTLDRLDGFVHSAGIIGNGPLGLTTPADFDAIFRINVASAAELVRCFLPALRAAEGTVVLVNSTSGLSAGPPLSAYGTSKYALRGLADALRAEEPSLRVTSVYPSRTGTDMQRELRQLEGQQYVAEDYLQASTVASVIVQALLLPADAVITDVVLRPRPGRGRGVS